jgi:intracellular septation protein
MQTLLELAPLLVFILAYALHGIYAATAALMVAMALMLAIDVLRTRRIPTMHALSTGLVFLFGTATLLLHDQRYIQWKPTVFFWLASAAFLASFWIGEKPLVARLLGKALDPAMQVPLGVWRGLNALWVGFYAALGGLNLLVAYHASERVWVSFKVFGLTLATAVFIGAQVVWLSRRIAPLGGAPATAGSPPASG